MTNWTERGLINIYTENYQELLTEDGDFIFQEDNMIFWNERFYFSSLETQGGEEITTNNNEVIDIQLRFPLSSWEKNNLPITNWNG